MLVLLLGKTGLTLATSYFGDFLQPRSMERFELLPKGKRQLQLLLISFAEFTHPQ